MKIAHQHTDSEEEDEVFLFFPSPFQSSFLPPSLSSVTTGTGPRGGAAVH